MIAREQRFVRGLVWAPDDLRVVYAADGTLMSVRAAGDSAAIALTRQGHDFEWTTSDDLSWQTVLP